MFPQDAHQGLTIQYSWIPIPAPVIPNIMRRRKGFEATPPPSPSLGSPSKRVNAKLPDGQTMSGRSSAEHSRSASHVVTLAAAIGTGESTSGEETEVGTSAGASKPASSRPKHASVIHGVQALFRPGVTSLKRVDTDTSTSPDDTAEPRSPLSPGKGGNGGREGQKYDPEEYQHAKKQLKKAMLECYR